MSTPIYELFIIKNNVASNVAQKALSEEEGMKLNKDMREAMEKVGATLVVACDSAFSNEETPQWGVIRYPDLQARIDQTRINQEIGWLNLVDAFTLLGTELQAQADVTLPDPIYKLWVIKSSADGAINRSTIPGGMEALMWEKHNALQKECAVQSVIICDTYWSNEAYTFFGVEAYPDVESMLTFQKGLVDLGWQRIFESFTLLGKRVA